MKKLSERVDALTTAVSAVLLAIAFIILAYNVFARFLGGGIQWYMEASQYLNVWAMLIAGIGLCSAGSHLRITALESLLKGKGLKANKAVIAILTVAFYLLFAYGTYELAMRSKQDISTMPPLKMAYIYWLMPVTGVLSAVAQALRAIVELTGRGEGADKP